MITAMNRHEAIGYIAATEMQCAEEFATSDRQVETAMAQCHEALRALGVTEQEIKEYA